MEDSLIVNLYWARSEQAIDETAKKYEKYCYTIANNILCDKEDALESVNDTYLGAWNSMPEHRPSILSTFLGKITRRISLKKYQTQSAQKRGGGVVEQALEELEFCIPSSKNVENEIEFNELTKIIDNFISSLPLTEKQIFVRRYWHLDSVENICKQFGFSQSKVKSTLFRVRKKLLAVLEKEGYR